ncbi:hypothetical protein A9G45_09885 [Gilliamella sp. HK2]|uniref:DDE-type integrase/transposase/recombinase n=1 Tax=unclassified Gilliamella TaxID=2685620 RepID=UPI00080E4222|nr:DDE-type integrase/transposase/recombinase [Gilliamella apicola]OCG25499.1 hypothetical protein A9G46_07135 [Gilliamella apicola]OCG27226.1 hypothetical protein A9G45_09885 [Gilliamella apicola]
MDDKKQIVVADLTYIRANQRWHYLLCFSEFIQYADCHHVGKHKTAELVMLALSQIKQPLSKLDLFHSDRGEKFDNRLLEDCFKAFNITHSLSKKEGFYDNKVAEATLRTIKTKFVKGQRFNPVTIP